MKAPSLLELESGVAIALAVGVAVGVFLIVRNARAAARGAVNAAAGVAGELTAGAIEGIGEQVGIPRTDPDKCEAAIADGRSWDASFYCPAGRFLKHIFSSSGSPPEPVAQYGQINPRDRT